MAPLTHDSLDILLLLVLHSFKYISSEHVPCDELMDFLLAKWALVCDVLNPLGDAWQAVPVLAAVQFALILDRYFIDADRASLLFLFLAQFAH